MYSQKEISLQREQFWTSLGVYMAPVLSAEGIKINWVNYKTGQKGIRIVMNVAGNKAYIGLEFTQADPEWQDLQFEKLLQFKTIFDAMLEGWEWERKIITADGKMISRVYSEIAEVNIMDRSHWPQLISFFKQRLVALDRFWTEYKFAFEQ